MTLARSTKTAHAERRPQGEVEAGGERDAAPFDFASLRSGRAGKYPTVGERVYESSVVRYKVFTALWNAVNLITTLGNFTDCRTLANGARTRGTSRQDGKIERS